MADRSKSSMTNSAFDVGPGAQVTAETFCGIGNNGKGAPGTDFLPPLKKLGLCGKFCVRVH
jgi:hypothetical protein